MAGSISTLSGWFEVTADTDFSLGEPVRIEPKNADKMTVFARVGAKLKKPRGYDPIINNCEHSANEVVTGQPFSGQLRAVVVIALVVGIALVALRKR